MKLPPTSPAIARAASADVAFVAASLEFDRLLVELSGLAARQFNLRPGFARHWDDVGSVNHANQLLQMAASFLSGGDTS